MNAAQSLTIDDTRRLLLLNQHCATDQSSDSLQLNSDVLVKKAGVLIPIIQKDDGLNILYTRRTETLTEHRGQVSFPGGAWETRDIDIIATALRETWEEIGIPEARIEVMGCLPARLLVTGYMVTPVIGYIEPPYIFNLLEEEVANIFSIPLTWLVDNANHSLRDFEYNNTLHKVIYFKTYSGEVLWGATARMTIELLALLGFK